MNIAFQMDDLSNINFNTDSTIALIFESQLRNNKNYIYTPDDLFIKNNIGQFIHLKSYIHIFN